jgi:hypothetical protein
MKRIYEILRERWNQWTNKIYTLAYAHREIKVSDEEVKMNELSLILYIPKLN